MILKQSLTMSSALALVLLILTFHKASTELFTALADMEELLETEAVLIANLDNYIRVQEDKLNQLRRYVHACCFVKK